MKHDIAEESITNTEGHLVFARRFHQAVTAVANVPIECCTLNASHAQVKFVHSLSAAVFTSTITKRSEKVPQLKMCHSLELPLNQLPTIM